MRVSIIVIHDVDVVNVSDIRVVHVDIAEVSAAAVVPRAIDLTIT